MLVALRNGFFLYSRSYKALCVRAVHSSIQVISPASKADFVSETSGSQSLISFSKFEIGLGRCARNHEFVKNLVLVVNQLHTHLRDNREDHQLDFYMGNYS